MEVRRTGENPRQSFRTHQRTTSGNELLIKTTADKKRTENEKDERATNKSGLK